MRRISLLLLTLLLALAAAGCGDEDNDEGGGVSGGGETPQAETNPPDEGSGGVETGCRDVDPPAPKRDGGESRPKDKLAADKTYTVTLETSCGTFSFELDQKTSPNAAASFASLVEKGFFEGQIFHRIAPEFVIQGGDPTASGTGGPGYSTRDRVPGTATYGVGTVAMAKAGNEPPGTAGSQFFVVTGEAGLTPDYALLGEVTDGLNVVQLIGEQGDPATEQPTRAVVIEKATLEER